MVGKKCILVTGGARSGKSRFAQDLAVKLGGPVLFVATAEAGDEEMKQRIEAHRKTRPGDWCTLEATTHVGSQILQGIGESRAVVVDCITLLVNNVFSRFAEDAGYPVIEAAGIAETSELLDCISRSAAAFIIVTNEVGLGLVPDNRLGRLYRDLLGKVNQLLAERADEVYLMVAGLPVQVKPVKT